jgi:hypothetical protein
MKKPTLHVPNFKPRQSGEMRRIGPLTRPAPPANKPVNEGVRRDLYWRK